MRRTFEDLVAERFARAGTVRAIGVALAEYTSLLLRGMWERCHRAPIGSSGSRRRPGTHEVPPSRERNRMQIAGNFKYALRGLLRTPGYTLAFVTTLALGIGANTAIFSVIHGVLLRPLPYPDADRIMFIEQVATKGGTNNTSLSFVEVADYRSQASTIDEVVEFGDWTFNVLDRGDPHLVNAGLVTANFFDVLGMRPHLGRLMLESDQPRTAEPVVVLTYDYWVRVFGADSNVIGQKLNLTVKTATIVGVLEPGSHYASMRAQPVRSALAGRRGGQDLYANYSSNDHYIGASMQDERTHRMTDVFARLAPDATISMARAELRDISTRLRLEYPDAYPPELGHEIVATPWLDRITDRARPMLLILFGTAVFVLVIACANVGNLTLTRLIRREREFAVRAAIGAARARLRGQLLAENLLLSLAGAVFGLVLAVTGLDLLVAYAARFTARTGEIGVDLAVLGFTLVIAVGAAILFAWMPALPFDDDLGAALTAAGGGRSTGGVSRRRAQRALVVSQLAISFMLLVGAGLLVRSLWRLSQVDPGFDLENVLTMDVPSFANTTRPQRVEFERGLVDRVSQHSHVHKAAMASAAPLGDIRPLQLEFRVEGRDAGPTPVTPMTVSQTVSAEYFETIGTPLVRGRIFDATDGPDAERVAILNRSMAEFYFPDQDPIGRRIARRHSNMQWSPWYTIVGVVADNRAAGLDSEPVHAVYMASSQTFPPATLLVRTAGDPKPIAGQVIEEVRALDPNRPVIGVQTLGEIRAESMAPQRLNATLFGIFALLALVIATVGIAGVLSFSVSQRTNEFGIRMTLGADQSRVLWMVLREGVVLAAIALAIGAGGALVLSKFLSGLLFEVEPSDPMTFAAMAVLLAAVALTASLAPARRATRVDPMEALRRE